MIYQKLGGHDASKKNSKTQCFFESSTKRRAKPLQYFVVCLKMKCQGKFAVLVFNATPKRDNQ